MRKNRTTIIITIVLVLGIIGLSIAIILPKATNKSKDATQIKKEPYYYSHLEGINLNNVINVSSISELVIDISNVEV